MIVNRINEYLSSNEMTLDERLAYEVEKLAGYAFKKQFMTNSERKAGVYMSSAGKCPRQQAYKFHDFPINGKEIDSRAKIVFFMGDLSELVLTNLAVHAGCNLVATGFQQLTVKKDFKRNIGFESENYTVYGHPDGILFENGESYLVEVKSMSSYAFDSFQKGEIDHDYQVQMMMYMEVLGLKKCVMLALNKDAGVIGERIIEYNETLATEGMWNIQKVLDSSPESLPDARYKPDDKGFYPWNCLYCGYFITCHPNAEKVLVSNKYKLREKQKETNKL